MQDTLILILSSVILGALVYKMYKTATSKEYIRECLNTRDGWKKDREQKGRAEERKGAKNTG